jgi:hypothetical protein
MLEFSTPFVVETSFRLPGLGLLVLPAIPEPSWLLTHSLHTAFTVTLPPSIQHTSPIIGTVEEISYSGQTERRALLLNFDPIAPLPSGIYLQVSKSSPELQ